MTRHPIWELLDKIQMDNRDQATKIVELRAHVASLDLSEAETHGQWQPALGVKDPVAAIRRQIENGAIADEIDLAAEFYGYALDQSEREQLREELAARLTEGERANKAETQSEKSSLGVST